MWTLYTLSAIFGYTSVLAYPRSTPNYTDVSLRDSHQNISGLIKRQACGKGIGSCTWDQCCSAAGQCGTGPTFCTSPDCQIEYGPSCDGNIPPPGPSTLDLERHYYSDVPYGTLITQCTQPNTVALTFDDGPYLYTQTVLDTLATYNNTMATFWITGNNLGKGRIDDPSLPWMGLLKKMHAAGHHIGSHSWSHEDFTRISPVFRRNQVIYNEMAFRNIFDWIPTYIRPPYGFCDVDCQYFLKDLGYHIVTWNDDPKDWANDDPALIHFSKDYFTGNLTSQSIVISHDIHKQTVEVLLTYMLDTIAARGYRAVSVGECLGDARLNWYRRTLDQDIHY